MPIQYNTIQFSTMQGNAIDIHKRLLLSLFSTHKRQTGALGALHDCVQQWTRKRSTTKKPILKTRNGEQRLATNFFKKFIAGSRKR